MKPNGSILEFTRERNDALMCAYRHQISKVKFINMYEIAQSVVNMPANRFWVSTERATIIVSALFAGKRLPGNMRATKKEMFMEIFNRVKELMIKSPGSRISHLVAMVVHSPAPKFYMLPRSAMDIIYKIKNGHYDRLYANNPIYRSRNN